VVLVLNARWKLVEVFEPWLLGRCEVTVDELKHNEMCVVNKTEFVVVHLVG